MFLQTLAPLLLTLTLASALPSNSPASSSSSSHSSSTSSSTSSSSSSTATGYIGLTAHFGTATSPCATTHLDFNLKPPTAWLSDSPTSHCLPGTPGDIHNITCVTRRLTPLASNDSGLDTKQSDMGKCDMWGYTEAGCKGKYWVASRGGAAADGTGAGQGWYFTEEERESGPDMLDIRSWQIDCLK